MMKYRGKFTQPKALHPSACSLCPEPIEKGDPVVLRVSGWVHAHHSAPAGAR